MKNFDDFVNVVNSDISSLIAPIQPINQMLNLASPEDISILIDRIRTSSAQTTLTLLRRYHEWISD